MFIGFVTVVLYSSIVENNGRWIADISFVAGLLLFVVALVILVREILQWKENL
jgi:hypothetical protein